MEVEIDHEITKFMKILILIIHKQSNMNELMCL